MAAETTTSTVTSTTLLESLDRGVDAAWRQVCGRYEPLLLRFARHCGLREDAAQDAAQETLTAFLQGFRAHRYEREKGRLRSWLQGIALNKIREARRRLARPEVQIADNTSATAFLNRIPDEHELTDLFEQEWERGVLAECLRRVREEVEPKTFVAFDLYVRQEWSADQVATHLGISRETVYVHKSRVLARMREMQQEIAEIW